MLSVRNLVKTYQTKKADTVVALNNVSIDFPETGLVFLLGKSGSGKSTLLNAIGGLDTFDSGEIIIKGKSSKEFSQSDFDSYRNTFIGFIFQEYNILENFTVQKNLALALELQGKKPDKAEIDRLLEQVEMTQYAKRKPNQLSGGQKQRVAIARALVKNPEIIMADEPTGALDSNTGKQVMDTLKELSKKKLVIIVSHDREFAEIYGDRIIELKDGHILHDVTKKEIEAQETASGIKIIDDSIVYIKKGQPVSENDMKAIVKIINENSQKNDTFISFDKKANEKLKEGAKITDDGNKEAFLKTEPEDIKTKAYNGKSLQLIKSRLKFSDSFKMGASALKNKVGKLIFTILLSFFAFTVFGIIDALSCWNRADSVYQAMQLQNKTNFAMIKYEKGEFGSDKGAVLVSDLNKIKEEYKDYVFKGVINTSWGYYDTNGSQIYIQDYQTTSTENPLKKPATSGFINVSNEDLTKLGFGIEGRLPSADNEIAISKFLFSTFVKSTATQTNKIEAFENHNPANGKTPLRIGVQVPSDNGSSQKEFIVVGVVDDKTDLSEYENMTEEEILDSETAENAFHYGFTRLCYVTESFYNSLMTKTNYLSYSVLYGDSEQATNDINLSQVKTASDFYKAEKFEYEYNNNGYWRNEAEHRLYTEAEMIARIADPQDEIYGRDIATLKADFYKYEDTDNFENCFKYIKGGLASHLDSNGNLVLADNEIIVGDSFLNEYAEDIYQSKIDEGVTVRFCKEWNGEGQVAEYTIIGVTNSWSDNIVSDKAYNDVVLPNMTGYSFVVSKLNGSETDKALIQKLETYDENNVKFSLQGETTGMLDMLEEILIMMTSVFIWVALGFAVFAGLMLMNFISTSISHKKREIGVLRALGARGTDIFGIFFNESMVIAMINFVLSAIATIVACSIINTAVLANFPLEIVLLNAGIRQIVLIFAISVAVAFIGSFLPTFKISRKKPIDAINNR